MFHPKDRLIFPLDVPNKTEAERLIGLLKNEIGLFKVGLELFIAEGPAFLQFMADEAKVSYFLDLKFHDIPATVKSAQARLLKGVKLATVHVDQGQKTLKASVEALKNGVQVLGVTVLTHLGPEDLAAMGMAKEYTDPAKLVLLRAKLAKEAGCDGVVCAGTEARAVKDAFGPDFLVVCPAIRPTWSIVAGDDQRRITTPYQAIRSGADYIVVGRPIRQAADPAAAARRVVQEIVQGMQDRK